MLLITYTPFGHLVDWRKWFFHRWNPPISHTRNGVMTEASYFVFDHHEITSAPCIRIFGVSIALVRKGREI